MVIAIAALLIVSGVSLSHTAVYLVTMLVLALPLVPVALLIR